MPPEPPIRPLRDVWLRPRRVFREMALRPIGGADFLLAAAQGVAAWLALSRAQNAGATGSVAEIFYKALLVGSLGGIASLFLMGTIYGRLAARNAGTATRNQVFHVMAYGGVPLAASLLLWVFTAVLFGAATFEPVPHPAVDAFAAILLQMQFIAYVLLAIWSVLIQIMGLSEIQGVSVRRALGLWILGQVIGFLALLFLMMVIATLLPNAVTG